MKFKFAVASHEDLLSDRPSQLQVVAEVKDYFHSSELNLHKSQSYTGLVGLISAVPKACLVL